MKLRSRLTGTVLIGTLTMFGLAACGSDDSKDDSGDNDTSSETTEDSGSDDSSEGDGDKPSKEEVIDGYTAFVADIAGGQLPEGTLDGMVTCIVDGVYDEMSADSLQALADGNAAGVAPEDGTILTTATTTCLQESTGQ